METVDVVNILSLGIVVGLGLGFIPILIRVAVHGILKIFKS